jgi:cysteine desulfurase
MKEIYFDNAAGTPVDRRSIAAMSVVLREQGNASAFNDAGRRMRTLLERARADVARFLNARSDEVVFCASGSEANTLAIIGAAMSVPKRFRRIVTTPIEHPSVLGPARYLQQRGWRVAMLPVDCGGRVDRESLNRLLTSRTALVSVMYANNEIGTIQPIKTIARMIREFRHLHRTPYPYLHVDACQAVTTLPMDVQALGVDLLTLNGAKAYGPHGSAALYIRRGVALQPLVLGGSQERGLRAGTEDVASAVGLAAALKTIRKTDSITIARLRDRCIARLQEVLPGARLNGPVGRDRLAGNINISIPAVSSEEMLLELDRHGIRAGSGSACTAHTVEPSHVLTALKTPQRFLSGVLRISIGRQNTIREIDRLLDVLVKTVAHLRIRSST